METRPHDDEGSCDDCDVVLDHDGNMRRNDDPSEVELFIFERSNHVKPETTDASITNVLLVLFKKDSSVGDIHKSQ